MTAGTGRKLALHIDDLGASLGANIAMDEAFPIGMVRSGSVIVNGAWFPDLVDRVDASGYDIGVHLALNSESAAFRWRPLVGGSSASGLVDDRGYMWADVPSLRMHADPEAVRDELHMQIATALAAGVPVSHVDHHMGAALAPEFVEVTADVVIAHGLPVLFPADIEGYVAGVDWFDSALGPLREQRERLVDVGLAFADSFLIPLRHLGEPVRAVLESMITGAPPGLNYVSLHCAAGVDIEAIHPNDAAWRIEEHRLLTDTEFLAWLQEQEVEFVDLRSQVR